MRLLAHTGIVGFALFAAFLVLALRAAARTRRGADPTRQMLAGAALMPLVVWLIHGSLDWFWEFPALSAPALGFLVMAGRLGEQPAPSDSPATVGRRSAPRPFAYAGAATAFVVATAVLGFPFLATRELSLGETASHTNPSAALADFNRSHTLNPLSSDPGTLGGTVALLDGRYADARTRFSQAITKEPGAWFAWLGRGLSSSSLGDEDAARNDFRSALRLNDQQAAVRDAAARVMTSHPLTVSEAFKEVNYLP
jgi:tetratricopeptide (TPR) repeat protein